MKKILILCATLILPYALGQDEKERKFFVGVNVGTKIGSKQYARRYDGQYNDELGNALINNTINYNQIYQLLGNYHFYLPWDYFPYRINYTPGLLTGLMIGYRISPNLQTSFDINLSKLTSRSAFTIVVDDPGNTTSQEIYAYGELNAKESRFDGRFNFDYIADGEKWRFLVGLSGIFTGWRIDSHAAIFDGYAMPLHSKHNPLNNISNAVSSIGWGIGANAGVHFKLNEMFKAQLLWQPYHAQFNTGIYIEKKLRIHHDFILRLIY